MTMFGMAFAVAALVCVAGAALADVRRFEIPDFWSVAVVLLFAGFAAVEWPLQNWWLHLAAGAVMFGVGVALFACGWLGGGDVKLLAACAVWTGFEGLPWLIAGTTLSGAVLAIVLLVARRLAGSQRSWPGLTVGGPLPYAAAILGGAGTFALVAT